MRSQATGAAAARAPDARHSADGCDASSLGAARDGPRHRAADPRRDRNGRAIRLHNLRSSGRSYEPLKELKTRWISVVRPSRQLLRSFLRMRDFLNAIKSVPHPEEAAKAAVSKDARSCCSLHSHPFTNS